LSYFYLLEGSKIFLMSSKCFIWIVHVLIYLKEFFWNFCDFRSIFSALNELLEFLWNSFVLKMYFRKKTLSYRIGPRTWARPNPFRPSRLARRGPSSFRQEAESATAGAGAAATWGVRAWPASRPYKGRSNLLCANPSPSRPRRRRTCYSTELHAAGQSATAG
jgi:hypothetical protein